MKKIFSTLIQAAILLALCAVAAALTKQFHPKAPALYLNQEIPGKGEISLEKALALESGVLWIDARVREAYDKEHIPGALSLEANNIDDGLFDLWDKIEGAGKPIVVYCDGGACHASKKVADKLKEIGIPDVYVLTNGWDAWKAANP